MKLGEILIQNGWLDRAACAAALAEQLDSGVRLGSLLVARGLVTFDHVARGLAEQHGVAAVLRRHLVGRDRSVASLVAVDFAREHGVLPIGWLADGRLIVCARDPSPAVHGALFELIEPAVVLAVTPASYLDRAIEEAYGEIEIPIDVDEPVEEIIIDIDIEAPKPRMPSVKPARRAARDTLETALGSFPDIDDQTWLLDVVTSYLATHWSASLLLQIRDRRRAIGVRGHGRKVTPQMVKTLVLDLEETNFIKRAIDERRIVDKPPAELGSDDEPLVVALETDACIVAPIVTGSDVGYVLVVAEPLVAGLEDAIVDLGLLADALGEALARLA